MKKLITLLVLTMALLMTGCGSEEEVTESGGGITFTDDLGREVTVENPQGVAVLLGSFADMCNNMDICKH